MDGLSIAILAGLAGMLGWGFADFFAKKTIDIVGDIATLAWAHIYGVIILITLVFAQSVSSGEPVTLPVSQNEWMGLAFFGAVQAYVYYFAYKAFGEGKLSLLNPVFSSYSGFVVLISVFVFGEIITGAQVFTLLAIITGIIFLSLDHESLKLKKLQFSRIKGMKAILAATGLAAIWTALWGYFVSEKDWLIYAAIMYFFMTITILLIVRFKKISLIVKNPSLYKFFALIGFSEVLAYVGVSLGYSETSYVSIVAVLSAAFSLPTLVLAYVFLRERINSYQMVGVATVVAGVVLMAVL